MLWGPEGIDTLMPMLGKVLPSDAQADSGVAGEAGSARRSKHNKVARKSKESDASSSASIVVTHRTEGDEAVAAFLNASICFSRFLLFRSEFSSSNPSDF